jgi:hypothetical protein
MTTWTNNELTTIRAADELMLASLRRDGTLRKPVTIWVVRYGDDLYVRSYKGRSGVWFDGTQARHEGHIQAGGVDKDVTFVEESDPGINDQIDTAYQAKYRRYGARYVDPMVAPEARGDDQACPARDPIIPKRTERRTSHGNHPQWFTALRQGAVGVFHWECPRRSTVWGARPGACRWYQRHIRAWCPYGLAHAPTGADPDRDGGVRLGPT